MWNIPRQTLTDTRNSLGIIVRESGKSQAARRRIDYDSLRGLSLPEIASILARKKFSKRRKRKGRTRERYTPNVNTEAKNNPLSTYTLTETDLRGPAYNTAGEEVDVMGPGTYKAYGQGKVIYWGTKAGAQPKVVSAKRLNTWLTVAKYGAGVSEAAARAPQVRSVSTPAVEVSTVSTSANLPFPERSLRAAANPISLRSRNNPMARYPEYSRDYLENASHLDRQTAAYYPGTMWDYYKQGQFGPEVSVPVNRRNPKPPSAALTAWRQQFKKLAQQAEFRAAAGDGMRAAWEKVYPKAMRHPKHHKDIETHIANNNPNPYALDMGPYSPSMVPVNRRNPAGKTTIARFPGECIVCGEAFIPRQDEITDSGQRGPKGGVKMKHVRC